MRYLYSPSHQRTSTAQGLFLKWVRTKGSKSHASGKCQKYLQPRQHPPKGVAQMPGNKQQIKKKNLSQKYVCDQADSRKVHIKFSFLFILFMPVLFVLRPTTGQVQHKAFIKLGLDAGSQPTCVQQNPKIPSAPLALHPRGAPKAPSNKQ